MDENRLNGWAFHFTESERAEVKKALGSRLADSANADAFVAEVESFIQLASEESSLIYGPLKERVAAVNKAASELRAALEALTPDDKEELQSYSAAHIPDTINDAQYTIDALTAAAGEIKKHIKPNQHARDGQAQARLLLVLSGRAWLKHFGKEPSVSKGAGRVSPFVRFMQAALGILGWPASFDFLRNAFRDVRGDITKDL